MAAQIRNRGIEVGNLSLQVSCCCGVGLVNLAVLLCNADDASFDGRVDTLFNAGVNFSNIASRFFSIAEFMLPYPWELGELPVGRSISLSLSSSFSK